MNGLKQNQQEQETMRPAVWAVIPAGGTGQRYSQNENKLLLNLLGQPVLWWSVKAFLETASIDGLVIAAHADYQEVYQHVLLDLIQAQNKSVFWATGFETRRVSVYYYILMLDVLLLV
jgi:2-C-methyl-D-erythritol 4-phosphate cytidylyltransferase